jgi:hypothetical protein
LIPAQIAVHPDREISGTVGNDGVGGQALAQQPHQFIHGWQGIWVGASGRGVPGDPFGMGGAGLIGPG